jgi:hypothetical protein
MVQTLEFDDVAKKRRVWGAKTRAKQRKAEAPPSQDLGTPEQWAKKFGAATIDEAGKIRHEVLRALEIEPRLLVGETRKAQGMGARNRAENPLDALYLRGLLGNLSDPRSRASALRRRRAGQRLRVTHDGAGIAQKTTVNLSAAGGGGGGRDQTDREAETEMVYYRMLKACGRTWALVRDVCCDLQAPAENAVVLGQLIAGLDLLSVYLRLRDDDDDEVAGAPPAPERASVR